MHTEIIINNSNKVNIKRARASAKYLLPSLLEKRRGVWYIIFIMANKKFYYRNKSKSAAKAQMDIQSKAVEKYAPQPSGEKKLRPMRPLPAV